MRNVKRLSRLTALLLVFVMLFTLLASCGETEDPDTDDTGVNDGDNSTPNPVPPTIKVAVTADSTVSYIDADAKITLSVTITGTENTAYTWKTEPAGILTVDENNVVSIASDAVIIKDTKVSVIAVSAADETAVGSKSFIVKAPVQEGKVGELTSEMIEALGNDKITVSGVVTDYYKDLLQSINDYETSYDTLVKMMDGKWLGTWNVTGADADKAVTELYRRNDVGDEVKDAYGDYGRPIELLYIGKDNEMIAAPVKNNKTPVIWESQHLWNHLGSLNVNRFTYDVDTDEYVFTLDVQSEAELYLMTYLSYCLTPMMTETLYELRLTIEDGAITKMTASTAPIYYLGDSVIDTAADAEYMTYTVVNFVFSDIGTTDIPDPVGFEAPEYADKLQTALSSLKDANNYSYVVKDTSTSAPSSSPDDYETAAATGTAGNATMMEGEVNTFPYKNYTAASGTVGERAWVVDGQMIIEKTGKYDYSTDGKNYFITYTGYINNAGGTYDEFYYDPDAKGFVGDRIWSGTIKENVLPEFVLSANIFEYIGTMNGVHIFSLREDAAVREVAIALSPYAYAKNAEATINDGSLTVRVKDDGTLESIKYSYNINDMYYGNYTITYSKVGTTTIAEGAFDNYIPRVIPTSWSVFTDNSYYYKHTTLCENYGGCKAGEDEEGNTIWDHSAHSKTVDLIMQDLFGEDASLIPGPDVFTNVFGDTMSTFVGFNWSNGTVAGTYRDYVSFNMSCDDYEKNDNYYEEAIARLNEALYALGFEIDQANTNMIGGDGAYSDRTVCYVNGGIQIVVENNRTSHFFIRIYKAGEWTLN